MAVVAAVEPPALLYKYYPPERLDVVESLLAKFSSPFECNDRFDSVLRAARCGMAEPDPSFCRHVVGDLRGVGGSFEDLDLVVLENREPVFYVRCGLSGRKGLSFNGKESKDWITMWFM